MTPDTPAARRGAIRSAVKQLVGQALSTQPAIPVSTSRLEIANVDQFIAIYFQASERKQHYSGYDSVAELVIRINAAADPLPDDNSLDLPASHIEAALAVDSTLSGTVQHSYLSGFSYELSKSELYSTLQLKYTLKYND